VKQNPVYPDPGVGTRQEDYFLYVGRLSEEKGIDTLIASAKQLRTTRFLVVGGSAKGDQEPYLDQISALQNMEYLGQLPHEQVFEYMKKARSLVFPSAWDEPFGLGVVESFACGVPVIASDRGAMSELVDNGRTGLLFSGGDSEDLTKKLSYAHDHPEPMRVMGLNARKEFERKYSGDENIRLLVEIYRRSIGA
jgi:glycosyltransferase involved in cell wall biosynthesis